MILSGFDVVVVAVMPVKKMPPMYNIGGMCHGLLGCDVDFQFV